ncbi:unnamed protein product [Closterium sp. NIES-65]|nr:unnamed protein product [Closterium sp. NIES-65]
MCKLMLHPALSSPRPLSFPLPTLLPATLSLYVSSADSPPLLPAFSLLPTLPQPPPPPGLLPLAPSSYPRPSPPPLATFLPPAPFLLEAARKSSWSGALFGAPSDGRTSKRRVEVTKLLAERVAGGEGCWGRGLLGERVAGGEGCWGRGLLAERVAGGEAVQIHASMAASLAEKKQKRVLLEGLMDRIKHMLPPADMDEVIGATGMVYTHAAVKLSDLSLTFTRQQDMSRSVKLPKEKITDSSTCCVRGCVPAYRMVQAGAETSQNIPALPIYDPHLLGVLQVCVRTACAAPCDRMPACADRMGLRKLARVAAATAPEEAVESDGQRTPSLSDVPPLKATL